MRRIFCLLLLLGSVLVKAESYNCPCIPCDLRGFFVSAEFLYWKPYVTGMFYAVKRETALVPILGGSVSDEISIQSVTFDYAPAFRIGAGFALPCTDLEISAYWTRFRESDSSQVETQIGTFLITTWDSTASIIADFAAADFDIYYNVLDVQIGKKLRFPRCCPLK